MLSNEPSHRSVWPSRNKANDPVIMNMEESLLSSLQNKIISAELGSDRKQSEKRHHAASRGSNGLWLRPGCQVLTGSAGRSQPRREENNTFDWEQRWAPAKAGCQSFASEIPGELPQPLPLSPSCALPLHYLHQHATPSQAFLRQELSQGPAWEV